MIRVRGLQTLPYKSITCTNSGGFRGGALGASAPPAESMVKNLNLPIFF